MAPDQARQARLYEIERALQREPSKPHRDELVREFNSIWEAIHGKKEAAA